MRKSRARAITPREANWQQDFVKLWSSAMWILAAIYLAAHSIH